FGRVEPQGDPPVTVMIDDIRREGLASHAEIRLTVREHFLAFGKPETDFANRLIDVLRHGPPPMGEDYPAARARCWEFVGFERSSAQGAWRHCKLDRPAFVVDGRHRHGTTP